jgi:hypothetical protein
MTSIRNAAMIPSKRLRPMDIILGGQINDRQILVKADNPV